MAKACPRRIPACLCFFDVLRGPNNVRIKSQSVSENVALLISMAQTCNRRAPEFEFGIGRICVLLIAVEPRHGSCANGLRQREPCRRLRFI